MKNIAEAFRARIDRFHPLRTFLPEWALRKQLDKGEVLDDSDIPVIDVDGMLDSPSPATCPLSPFKP